MAKQLLREGIWRSGRLRRCSLETHLAFAYLFPIADHWGRWEYDLALIRGQVGIRDDITPERIKGWLDELEGQGLFRRYEAGGKLCAAWMNYAGMPVSQRSPSMLPAPPFDNSRADPEGVDLVVKGYVAPTPDVGAPNPQGTSDLDIGEGRGLGEGGGVGEGHRSASSGEAGPRSTADQLLILMNEVREGKPEERVFTFWKLATGKSRAVLTDARRKVLRLRLREEAVVDGRNFVEGLFRAVAGAIVDPHYSGDNDRATKYWEFENIFVHEGRNRIERLQAAWERARSGVTPQPEAPRTRGGKVAAWLKNKHRGDA